MLGLAVATSPAQTSWCFPCGGYHAHNAWAFHGDGKQSPADAHDARAFRDGVISKTPLVLWLLGVEGGARLMLMVLGLSAEGKAQLMLF